MSFLIGGLSKKVDVVICSKARYNLLPFAVSQVRSIFPCGNVIVVDSNRHPNFQFICSLGVKVCFTPDALLGVSRQAGLESAETDVVGFVDDDIILEPNWFPKMWSALSNNPKALAVSSKVVFGYQTDKTLEKLHSCNARGEGASIGVALLKRKPILAIGGFNPLVHRGEDAELELRMKSKGYKWLRCNDAIAYHRLTFREFMDKTMTNMQSWHLIWNHSNQRLRFIVTRTGATFIMPFYYGLETLDFKVFMYYALFKFKTLINFLATVNK